MIGTMRTGTSKTRRRGSLVREDVLGRSVSPKR